MFLHHFINNCNLAQLIDEPTREPSNTLLDVIMTNSPASVNAHGVLEPICSDHKPVNACLNFTHKYNSAILRTMWDFKMLILTYSEIYCQTLIWISLI